MSNQLTNETSRMRQEKQEILCMELVTREVRLLISESIRFVDRGTMFDIAKQYKKSIVNMKTSSFSTI